MLLLQRKQLFCEKIIFRQVSSQEDVIEWIWLFVDTWCLKDVVRKLKILSCIRNFSQTLTIHRTAGERTALSLFITITYTSLQTFRHIFEISPVRWLRKFLIASYVIDQAAIRWDFPPLGISIWLIFNGVLILVDTYLYIRTNFVRTTRLISVKK